MTICASPVIVRQCAEHKGDAMRAKPVRGTAYTDRLQRAVQRRESGWTLEQIAEAEGVHRNTIDSMLSRNSARVKFKKVCALLECGQEFETGLLCQLYCCREHGRLGDSRQRDGRVAAYRHCRLPGCREKVVVFDGGSDQRKFCSKKHLSLFYSRTSIGFYDKLINRTKCSTCDYWGPGLHEHHIQFKSKGGSNDQTNLMLLCPSCHTLLHAGLLRLDGTGTVDLREEIRDAAIERLAEWEGK